MDLVQEGHVTVNGLVVTEPSTPVDPTRDVICYQGRKVASQQYAYILLNKPQGYTTTTEDPFAEKTVIDLMPAQFKTLNPAGRLDKNTEGVLLLTNDGAVAYKLTHPSFNIDKIYFAHLQGVLTHEHKSRLEKGVVIDGEKTSACRIFHVETCEGETALRISIHEGRKRQIRRMFEKFGYEVLFLKREQQGPLKLGDLEPGQWRELTAVEVDILKRL